MKLKHRIFSIIQPHAENDVASAVFDWFIIVIIAVNVLLLIIDTFDGIPSGVRSAFSYFEVASIVVFSIEYLLRIWTADMLFPGISKSKARVKYALTFMAIIDLFAILPFYLPFLFSIDLRVLRMIRLLRVLRILKVNRYTHALLTVGAVLKRKAAQLLSSILVVFVLMVIASILMYSIEHDAQPEVFSNAFSGLWWAIATLTTVGYGDIYPVTVFGRLLGAIIALLGIGLVAVPTGIISAGFMEDITHNEDSVAEEKRFCPYCGKHIEK